MTDPQPEALAAFLASAEYAILQAPQGSDEDASEALIAAGCWYAPRLLGAIEAGREAAGCTGEDVTDWQRGYRACSERVLEAISDALLGEGERGDVSATHESESAP